MRRRLRPTLRRRRARRAVAPRRGATRRPCPAGAAATPDPGTSTAPYRIYNIGNHRSESLEDFIGEIEKATGKRAIKNYLPLQQGDVVNTYADVEALRQAVGFEPKTPISVGIPKFVEWYRNYYGA